MAIQTRSLDTLKTQIEQLMDEINKTLFIVEQQLAAASQQPSDQTNITSLYEQAVIQLQKDIDVAQGKLSALSLQVTDRSRIDELATKDTIWRLRRVVALYANQEVYHEHPFSYVRGGKTYTDRVAASYGEGPTRHHLLPGYERHSILDINISDHPSTATKYLGFERDPSGTYRRNGKPSFA